MFKKLLVTALVLALAVCMFVACGGPAETDAPETNAPETNAPETDPVKCNGDDIHDVEVEEVLATCQSRGYRRETCKVCGEIISESGYPKAACTPVAPATCTADSVCSLCGTVIEAATGHTASENVVQDLGCSVVYSCAGTNCTETITVEKENAQHTLSALESVDKNTVVKGSSVCVACSACGQYVPVPEDVRLALNFDKESVAAEFEALNNDKISFYTKEDAKKGPSAQVKTNGDRSVLYFAVANPLFIDYDLSLLSDAEVFTITFDYCVGRAPYVPSNQVSLFTFAPAMKGGATIPGIKCPWVQTIKFDRTSLYFTDGSTTQYFQPEYGRWYTITLVVDNAYVNSSGKNCGKVYVFVDGEYIRSNENAGCTQYVLDTYSNLSWRIGEMGNTHDPQYDNFKVAVIK